MGEPFENVVEPNRTHGVRFGFEKRTRCMRSGSKSEDFPNFPDLNRSDVLGATWSCKKARGV